MVELTGFHLGNGGLNGGRRRREPAEFIGGRFWSAARPGICASARGRIRPAGFSCGGTVQKRRLRTFQGATGDFAGHGREALQEFIKSIVVFQVIEQRLHGHAGSLEDGCAAEDIRVHRNQIA